MENWHLDNCWQLQQFNHGLKVGQDYIIYYIIIAVEWQNENEVFMYVVFPKMLGCIGEAEIGRQINAATTLSLFYILIFCILVIRLEVGCSCCSCCRGALHHNLLLTTRNSTLLISQCGGVLVPGPHWVFGVGLSFNCIVKLINWYISIVFILIGLLIIRTFAVYRCLWKKIFGSALEP